MVLKNIKSRPTTIFGLIVGIALLVLFGRNLTTQAAATDYYVDGSNKGGNSCSDSWSGTITQPFCTITKAQSLVVPGSTVFVRGGIYKARLTISQGSGTITAPVTYTPYNSEPVLIDGTGLSLSNSDSLVNFYKVNNIVFKGFEVANSSGRGIGVNTGNNILIQNNKVHNVKYHGINVSGSSITIDNNEVYDVVNSNLNGVFGSSGWAQAISTWKKSDGSASQNITFSNNNIYNSWGEGIDVIAVDGARVTGNRIRDVFSVMIYMDNARNVVVDSNHISAINPTFYRSGKPATGITFSAESCCRPTNSYQTTDITINNNLVINPRFGISYWLGSFNNPYSNVLVHYNTIINPTDYAIYLDSVTTSGNQLINNIIYGRANMPNSSAWQMSNNNWVTGKPSIDTSSSSFSADPNFVNPVTSGSPEGYKLKSISSSIARGVAVSSTNKDYFANTRPTKPSLGFAEPAESSSGTPQPTTKIGDANQDSLVNESDYSIWLANYLRPLSGLEYGDFNNDGSINGVDYVLWINNYGQ